MEDLETAINLAENKIKLKLKLIFSENLLNHREFYVSGSLVSYMIAKQLYNITEKKKFNNYGEKPNDLDIYSQNPLFLMFQFGSELTGYDVVPSIFKNIHEVIDYYDSTLVQAAFHVKTSKIIYTDRFFEDVLKKRFHFLKKPNSSRQDKLCLRAQIWFQGEHQIYPDVIKSYKKPFKTSFQTLSWQDQKYGIQKYSEFFGGRPCVAYCGNKLNLLENYPPPYAFICDECVNNIQNVLNSTNYAEISESNIVVIGGRTGFGNYIVKNLLPLHPLSLTATSRVKFEMEGVKTLQYDFIDGKISDELRDTFKNAHIMIVNGWTNIEKNYWHSLSITDGIECFNKNSKYIPGFMKFINLLIEIKRENLGLSQHTTLVCIDADESHYKDKLKNGKHVGYNCVKSGQIQTLWTYSEVLGSLGVTSIIYNPNWINYNPKTPQHVSLYDIASRLIFLVIRWGGTVKSLYFIKKSHNALPLYPGICQEISFYSIVQSLHKQKRPTVENLLDMKKKLKKI